MSFYKTGIYHKKNLTLGGGEETHSKIVFSTSDCDFNFGYIGNESPKPWKITQVQ